MENDQYNVKFQLFDLKAAVNIALRWEKVGLDKEDTDQIQTCTIAMITGRRPDGRVFKSSGIAIQHPSDGYDHEVGVKLAVQNAACNLWQNDEAAQMFISQERYVKTWWSAYQRARHNQPPLSTCDLWSALAFS